MNTPKAALIFKHLPKELCLHIDRFRKHPLVDCIKSKEFTKKYIAYLKRLLAKMNNKGYAYHEECNYCDCSYTKENPIGWEGLTYWEDCRGIMFHHINNGKGGRENRQNWNGYRVYREDQDEGVFICDKCRNCECGECYACGSY